MTSSPAEEAARWAAAAPGVDEAWFARPSRLHGAAHTRRVHVHAQRLAGELAWSAADTRLVLAAALYHDIGRVDDGETPGHGAASAARADALGLLRGLAPEDAAVVRFAIRRHSLPDAGAVAESKALAAAGRLGQPERAVRVLWLLKDADALDRPRLGGSGDLDPSQLRNAQAVLLVPFAEALLRVL